ncbi:SWIRM domain-containing protein [Purpureocillium lilacinum]|uniref:SWIRM domain-containing protein n=1 Tax=Purpureocillium lilacinum TaxID=33203 RepID=A0A179F8F3_PURLI|nr:SWIRM domain-containing protein [Purpureocillium lilacinum]OAQ61379.1 SWIRM domain-containing protein [Purpureocillium lilacinum]
MVDSSILKAIGPALYFSRSSAVTTRRQRALTDHHNLLPPQLRDKELAGDSRTTGTTARPAPVMDASERKGKNYVQLCESSRGLRSRASCREQTIAVGASMSKAASAQSMHDPIHTGKDLNCWHSLNANINAQSGKGTSVLVASVDHGCAVRFHSRIMKLFTADRKGWLRRNRALLESDRRARPKRYQVMAKSNMADCKKQGVVVHENRVREDAGQVQAPTGFAICSCDRGSKAEPCQVVQASRDDKDFTALPDYSPSLNTLSRRTNCLKVDWDGRPLDLGDDPYAYLLHPEEVTLASTLRLDCATYLTSKRHIFQRRLVCLRIGKEFRKTDAQKACGGLVRRVIHAPIPVNRLALSNCFGSVRCETCWDPQWHCIFYCRPPLPPGVALPQTKGQHTLSDDEGAQIIVHQVGDSGRVLVLWSVIPLHRRVGRRVRLSCGRGSGHSGGRSSLWAVATLRSWHARPVALSIAVEFDVGRLGSVVVLRQNRTEGCISIRAVRCGHEQATFGRFAAVAFKIACDDVWDQLATIMLTLYTKWDGYMLTRSVSTDGETPLPGDPRAITSGSLAAFNMQPAELGHTMGAPLRQHERHRKQVLDKTAQQARVTDEIPLEDKPCCSKAAFEHPRLRKCPYDLSTVDWEKAILLGGGLDGYVWTVYFGTNGPFALKVVSLLCYLGSRETLALLMARVPNAAIVQLLITAVQQATATGPIIIKNNPSSNRDAQANLLAFFDKQRQIRQSQQTTLNERDTIISTAPPMTQCYGSLKFDGQAFRKMPHPVRPPTQRYTSLYAGFNRHELLWNSLRIRRRGSNNQELVEEVDLVFYRAGFGYTLSPDRRNWRGSRLVDHSEYVHPQGFGTDRGAQHRFWCDF